LPHVSGSKPRGGTETAQLEDDTGRTLQIDDGNELAEQLGGEDGQWLTLGCAAASVVARLARYRGGSKAGAPAECTFTSQLTKEPTGVTVSAARTRTPKS